METFHPFAALIKKKLVFLYLYVVFLMCFKTNLVQIQKTKPLLSGFSLKLK